MSMFSRRVIRPGRALMAGVAALALAAGTVSALTKPDPGKDYQDLLNNQSQGLFGFGTPLASSASGEFDGPGDQAVQLAKGLKAAIVSSGVGQNADMIALWPDNSNP